MTKSKPMKAATLPRLSHQAGKHNANQLDGKLLLCVQAGRDGKTCKGKNNSKNCEFIEVCSYKLFFTLFANGY
jgi:hypothetical protein